MTTVDDALNGTGTRSAEQARRTAVRTFRPRRSWPASIVGLVVLAVAVLAAAEIITTLVGAPIRILPYERVASYVGETRWSDPSMTVASIIVAVIGLLLISLALIPGRSRWFALQTLDPQLVVGLSEPSLRRAIAAAASEVSGVRGAHVKVRGRRVAVRAHTELRHGGDSGDLAAQVRSAAERRLAELAPVRTLTVRVRIRYAK